MRLPSPYDRLLLPVYLPSLLMSTSQNALLILLPIYVVDSGYSAAFAAVVVGFRGVGVLLFDVPAGMLVARFGDKPVLLSGLGLILIGSLALALAAHPIVLVLASLLMGAGFAAWMLGRQSHIAESCENHEVGRAIAVMAGLQRVGIFIGPAAGGLLAETGGYAALFVVAAAFAVIAAVFVLSFASNVHRGSTRAAIGLGAMLALARGHARIFATAGGAALALQLMRATRQLLVPLFGRAIGLDVAEIGLVYSLSASIDMCLFYPVGIVVDRHGRKWSAVPSLALFVAGLALLPLAEGFYSLLAVSLLLGVANGLGTGIVMIMGADLAQRTEHRGQFLGLWRLIGDMGMSASPLLSGALVNAASLGAASLVVAGIGLLGVAVMIFLVPETLGRPGPADVRLGTTAQRRGSASSTPPGRRRKHDV